MNKHPGFSRQVKDELSQVACTAACCRQAEIGAAFYGAGRFHDQTITLSTSHAGCARRLTDLIRHRYGRQVDWQAGHDLLSLRIDNAALYQAIVQDMLQLFGFTPDGESTGRLNCRTACCQKAVLRMLFLTCGSISEPASAYHLELSIRNIPAAQVAVELLEHFSIRAGLLHRHGYSVVYMNEGQYLADYLLLSGAHLSLLTFESLRVEKDMRNTVNRVVNCDSANTQRVADTAARQLELIEELEQKCSLNVLAPELLAAATARLANPDLSLKELGEIMEPPLGKSGMNHRLQRLEKTIQEILERKDNDNCEP